MKLNSYNLFFVFIVVVFGSHFCSALERSYGYYDNVFRDSMLAVVPIEVNGRVTDASGVPLGGVNVLIKGTSRGVVTDFDGYFQIQDVEEDAVLLFSYLGFLNKEFFLDGQTNIAIVMEEAADKLDEVVVVGYGTQSRETLTSAVSKLDNEVLENTVYGDASSALQGSVSGVRVQSTSGQPGASPRVLVRGGTSINNPNGAEPLYVVNGVIRDDLDGINSADIESIQVLKDAASTAIYGARASNGVVIVSLKKGVLGKSSITFNSSIGISSVRKRYKLLGGGQYIYYNRLGIAATGEKHPERLTALTAANGFGTGNDLTNRTPFTTQYLTPGNAHKLDEGWKSMADPLDPTKTIIYDETDWQDELFRTGVTRNYHLNFSGGNEKATFNMGIGYTDIDGIAIETGYDRLTADLNGKMWLGDNLYAFGGLNFSRSNNNSVYSENLIFERSIFAAPTTKYYFEDGSLAPGNNKSIGNPKYHLERDNRESQDNIMTLNAGLNWNILSNLTFEPTISLFHRTNEGGSFQKAYFNGPTTFVDSRVSKGSYSKRDQTQFDAVLTYSNVFNERHNFQVKVGSSYYNRYNNSLSAEGRGAATDLISTLNASAEPVRVDGLKSEQVIFGYFGRITYDYDRKYLMTLNARYDGASNLGDNYKWGFFPGVSVGWNVHNEDFFNDTSLLSSLKIRGSYGVNGNLGNLSDFQSQGEYRVGSTYDGIAGVEFSTLANNELKWEESKTFDFGVDLGLFEKRLQMIFDYYNRKTGNLITSLALPQSTGFTSTLTNLGKFQNKGVEVEISGQILAKTDFYWNVAVNASYNSNKILKLPENDNENNRIGGLNIYDPKLGEYTWKGGLQEGGKIGELYGYQQQYIYATDEEALTGPYDELVSGADKTKIGGDVAWLDVDGNDVIDSRDKVYMGNIYPEWTGGASTTAGYKGFSLYVRMDYALGHTIFNYVRANAVGNFVGLTNQTDEVLNTWLNQGDQTDLARFYWADQVAQQNYWRGDPRNLNNGNGNSIFYEKGDYLALREVTISYQLSKSLIEKMGIENLRFNLTGNNLKYFTSYKGLAPEDGGMDHGRYPVPRIVTLGLKASF